MTHTGVTTRPGEEDQAQPRKGDAARRVGPFVLGMLLAVAVVPLAQPPEHHAQLAVAAALVVALGICVLTVPWRKFSDRAHALPVLATFPIIALLRHAEGGGSSAHAALLTLPLLWLALYASRRLLLVGLGLGALTIGLPPLLVGAPEYPASEWPRLAVFAFVGPIATFVVHDLVRRVRLQAETVETLRGRLALTEESFRAAFVDAPTAQFMCAPTGTLLRVNDGMGELLGVRREELFGAEPADLFVAEDAARVEATLLELWADADSVPIEFEARVVHAQGDELVVLLRMAVVRAEGRPLFLLCHVIDVTARASERRDMHMRADGAQAVREATEGLAEAPNARERLCQAAVEVSGATAALLLEADGTGSLVATGAHGCAPAPLTVEVGRDRSHAATALASHDAILAAADDPSIDRDALGGDVKAVLFEPILHDGAGVGVLVVAWAVPRDDVRDEALVAAHLLAAETGIVLARSDRLEKLTRLAHEDPLTGLSNRRVWEEQLPREMARATRDDRPLCVGMIDLDHFKAYNDGHGHAAGDRLLLGAAMAWRERLRRSDVLARYGGEEFAVILPSCGAERALALLERLREATPEGTTCSIGLAEWDGRESPQELVERADRALYAAKRDGRDRTAVAPTDGARASAA